MQREVVRRYFQQVLLAKEAKKAESLPLSVAQVFEAVREVLVGVEIGDECLCLNLKEAVERLEKGN